MITLSGLPVPPTVNSAFFNVPGRGRSKSASYFAFDAEINRWIYSNRTQIFAAKKALQDCRAKQSRLTLSLLFYLHRSRLIAKNGNVKRFDVSNRIKALEDKVSHLLEIDDSFFWKISAEKLDIPADEQESVIVIIDQMDL